MSSGPKSPLYSKDQVQLARYGRRPWQVVSVPVSVTQTTNVSTGVTAHGPSVIITQAAALTTGQGASFTLTNSSIESTSLVRASIIGGAGSANGKPAVVGCANAGSGSVVIHCFNTDAAAAQSAALRILVEVFAPVQ